MPTTHTGYQRPQTPSNHETHPSRVAHRPALHSDLQLPTPHNCYYPSTRGDRRRAVHTSSHSGYGSRYPPHAPVRPAGNGPRRAPQKPLCQAYRVAPNRPLRRLRPEVLPCRARHHRGQTRSRRRRAAYARTTRRTEERPRARRTGRCGAWVTALPLVGGQRPLPQKHPGGHAASRLRSPGACFRRRGVQAASGAASLLTNP